MILRNIYDMIYDKSESREQSRQWEGKLIFSALENVPLFKCQTTRKWQKAELLKKHVAIYQFGKTMKNGN